MGITESFKELFKEAATDGEESAVVTETDGEESAVVTDVEESCRRHRC